MDRYDIDRSEFYGNIIDIFEDFLGERGVIIPNEEKCGSLSSAIIYGSDYGDLKDELEKMMKNWSVFFTTDGGEYVRL